MKRNIFIALSILLCVPPAHADQVRPFDRLMQQIKNHDAHAFNTLYKKATLTTSEQFSLLERAEREKAALHKKQHRHNPDTWSDVKAVGWGSALLLTSAIMAAPMTMQAVESVQKKDASHFFKPSPKMLSALFWALCLAQSVAGAHKGLDMTVYSAATLHELFPNHQSVLLPIYASCLYLICACGSITAAIEGYRVLKQVLFEQTAIAKKLKNLEIIIETLTRNSPMVYTHHVAQGMA